MTNIRNKSGRPFANLTNHIKNSAQGTRPRHKRYDYEGSNPYEHIDDLDDSEGLESLEDFDDLKGVSGAEYGRYQPEEISLRPNTKVRFLLEDEMEGLESKAENLLTQIKNLRNKLKRPLDPKIKDETVAWIQELQEERLGVIRELNKLKGSPARSILDRTTLPNRDETYYNDDADEYDDGEDEYADDGDGEDEYAGNVTSTGSFRNKKLYKIAARYETKLYKKV